MYCSCRLCSWEQFDEQKNVCVFVVSSVLHCLQWYFFASTWTVGVITIFILLALFSSNPNFSRFGKSALLITAAQELPQNLFLLFSYGRGDLHCSHNVGLLWYASTNLECLSFCCCFTEQLKEQNNLLPNFLERVISPSFFSTSALQWWQFIFILISSMEPTQTLEQMR